MSMALANWLEVDSPDLKELCEGREGVGRGGGPRGKPVCRTEPGRAWSPENERCREGAGRRAGGCAWQVGGVRAEFEPWQVRALGSGIRSQESLESGSFPTLLSPERLPHTELQTKGVGAPPPLHSRRAGPCLQGLPFVAQALLRGSKTLMGVEAPICPSLICR